MRLASSHLGRRYAEELTHTVLTGGAPLRLRARQIRRSAGARLPAYRRARAAAVRPIDSTQSKAA
jgi:hypothetical protein